MRITVTFSECIYSGCNEMLACLVLSLITAASWGSVSGECEFPPDHPVHYSQLYSSQGQPLVQPMNPGLVYVYSDTFSTCGGCVRSVSFCYSPGLDSVVSETLFTVEIRKSNETIKTSYDVTVHPINDRNNRSNCISDLLEFPYCCIREVVAEPFSVKHDYHYALRVPSGQESHLLRHLNALASGFQYNINSNSNSMTQEGMLYRPLFFFTIDSTTIDFCTTITDISGMSVKSSPTISRTNMSTTSPTVPKSTDSGSQSSVGVGVGGGVGAAVVLLVVVGVLGVGLFWVWRRRHTSKLPASAASGNNSVYKSEDVRGIINIPANDNVAYGTTNSINFTGEDEYDYIPTTDGNDIITTSNEAYATTDNVPVSSNQAYGMVQH